MKNEKGSTIVIAVLTFTVLFIFTMTITFLGFTNYNQADREEKNIKAYYVAKTGADALIKHLEDTAESTGDMSEELEELVLKSDSENPGANPGIGSYKEGDFKIEVKKNKNKDDTVSYKIISTGEMRNGNNVGMDTVTALLTPKHESFSWGIGTVDAGEKIFVKGLHNLEGNGIILNTSAKKGISDSKSPIEIQEGYSENHEIIKLFDGNNDGTREKHGYKLKRTNVDPTHIKSEIIDYDKLPEDAKPVTLNYGVERKKPEINIPSTNKSNINLKNEVIDVNSSTPSEGTFVTEAYNVIDFEGDGDPKKKTKNKEFLKIETSELQISGNNEIKTSLDKDVVIYTNLFTLDESAKLNITGPGKVYIYANEKLDLINKSKLGIDLDVDLEDRIVNLNIHLYIGKNDVQIGNHTELGNTYIYGKAAEVQLAGNSVFTGRISANKVKLRDNITLRSPSSDEDSDDQSGPITGFTSIEWEK